MTNNIVKKIINEELSRYNGKLNVFDFDETLVSDVATVYVIKSDGSKLPLGHNVYKKYIKQPGDKIDITEFSTVNDPIVNWPVMNLLKSSQGNSIILTARTLPGPIEAYLKTLQIDVPVFAVGTDDPDLISAPYNAKMKGQWLRDAINTFNIKEIEFWDDNGLNLYAAEELGKELNVKVITHQIVFNPRKI